LTAPSRPSAVELIVAGSVDWGGPLEALGVDRDLIVLLGLTAVLSLCLTIWGIVRLFRGGHWVAGVLSLFLPLLALLGFFLSPLPHSALDRKRRRKTQRLPTSPERVQFSNSQAAAYPVTAARSVGSEDPTEEIPVYPGQPHQFPGVRPIAAPPSRGAGSRTSLTIVWGSIAVIVVGLLVAHLVILSQYRSSVGEVTASVAELSARAVTANDAWDTGEAPLSGESAERRSLYRDTEEKLEGIVADTVAISSQAADILRPVSSPRDQHDRFVSAVADLTVHAEGMLAGLRLPGRANKEDRLNALAAYRDAAGTVLAVGSAITRS
jgi:hypothetical protein